MAALAPPRTPNEDLALRAAEGIISGMMLGAVVSPMLGTLSMPAAKAIRQIGTLMLLGGALGGFNGIRNSMATARSKEIAIHVLFIGALLAKAAIEFYNPISAPARLILA